jgi:hypothetical protein
MKKSLLLFVGALTAWPALGAVLTQAPSPMTQNSPAGNGMSHIDVGWNDISSILTTHVAFQPVDLKPLSVWQPTSTFDPTSPWYSALDPSQGAGLFNSQYGWLADSASLPASLLGSRFLVDVVPGSATTGLEIYRSSYSGGTQIFEPILGTDGSAASFQWTGSMLHPMIVMPSGSSGAAAVTFRFTITDGSYVPRVEYAPVDATVTFNAIPEPSLALLALPGVAAMLIRRRRSLP